MPSRPVHAVVGFGAGAAAGAFVARHQPPQHRTAEIAGAGIGGLVGALLPDLIEPATSPRHRDVFHSLFLLLGIGAASSANRFADALMECRRRATDCDSRSQLWAAESKERSDEQFKALLWRAVAGLLVGLAAGYASHLALDGATPAGLPLLTNGTPTRGQ